MHVAAVVKLRRLPHAMDTVQDRLAVAACCPPISGANHSKLHRPLECGMGITV
jgi:hypothetical protein